ncbi:MULTISPECIES: HdeD family acid-resistance protein [Micrococcaceae]|uniref:HdeD family acid-resistance protein n=1 Tax=Micrococcaceae TaxID=1268 RepID=UPI0016091562|nr:MULTISPECIES: DUF308 domain-containing protein [Micrococcaceae]MBB5750389.1 uncharacterized membrane protein HdeD (DUF308 family) [Micrococcus sp. TA1]HRO29744.1 DUF308 domain-containing protein [Citricoccus sp.]HRO94872.1 DUF308 domain-containing protein [Citricoccus sp.]
MTRETDRRRTDDWGTFEGLEEEFRNAVFWWLLVRGVLALVFGLVMVFMPGAAAAALSIVIGIWLVLDGVTGCAIAGRRKSTGRRWGMPLLGGVVAILAGLALVVFPYALAVVGGVAVLWILAIGLAVRGLLEITDRRSGRWGSFLGLINVVVAIVLAVVMFVNPLVALGALVLVVGIYGVVFGLTTIISAFRVRRA